MKKFLFIAILASSFSGFGQYNEVIRSGRPGQSIGPFGVGKNVIQFQHGFDLSRTQTFFQSQKNESINVLRFGLTERFEINTAWRYSVIDAFNIPTVRTSGISLGAVGCRINIFEGDGFKPAIGFQTTIKFPRLSKEFVTEKMALRSLFILRQKISTQLIIVANIGVDYSGNSADPAGVFVLNLGYNPFKKLGFFIETFGNFNPNQFNLYVDGGARYLLTNNFQVDLSVGYGKTNSFKTYLLSTGISWRITSLYQKSNQDEIN